MIRGGRAGEVRLAGMRMLPSRMKRELTGLSIVVGLFAVLAVTGSAHGEPLDGSVADRVRAYVTGELDALGVPAAAIAIVRDDEVVLAEGFGHAGGVAVTARTPFDLASVSKSLTAIAVLQLAEAGSLGLDDPVREHVSWIDDAHAALGDITVRDLLGHASGWTIGDGQANLADAYGEPDAIERNVRRLASIAPTHSRGTFEYSNANYDLLAYLVEVASGIPYAEYMTESVFGPLDMADAHASRVDAEADGLAQGHIPFLGLTVPYEVPYIAGSAGSGFLHASAEDLAHVLVFHLNHGRWNGRAVLGSEWVEELHRPTTYADTVSGYAGGLWTFPFWPAGTVDATGDVPEYQVPMTLQHEGDHSSAATGILLFPEEGWGVATLLPMSDTAAPSRFHQIDDGIGAILLGLDPPPTTAYEDLVMQHIRLIVGLIALTQLAGIAVAVRRLRRWRARSATAPHGVRGVLVHQVVPDVPDVGVPAAVWGFYLQEADAPVAVAAAHVPDILLLFIVVTLLGIGWGVVRAIATARAMRSGASGPGPSLETAPAA